MRLWRANIICEIGSYSEILEQRQLPTVCIHHTLNGSFSLPISNDICPCVSLFDNSLLAFCQHIQYPALLEKLGLEIFFHHIKMKKHNLWWLHYAYNQVLPIEGIQKSGILHPLASVPPGQTIWSGAQCTGQAVLQIAVASWCMQYPFERHPFSSFFVPGHIISSFPHTIGHSAGHPLAVLDGIQVSGIGHPSWSTPPGHTVWSGPHCTGQVCLDEHAELGSTHIHVSGLGHPFSSTPPGHFISPSLQLTGQELLHFPSEDLMGMHDPTVLHPEGSTGEGQNISSTSPQLQVTSHAAGHFAAGRKGRHRPWDGQPFSFGLPMSHISSFFPHTMGHSAGQPSVVLDGRHVSGIGQPSLSTPPPHFIMSGPHCISQNALSEQRAWGSTGLHQVTTGHPSGPISPPQVNSLSLHLTGSVGAGGHFCPVTNGNRIQARNNFMMWSLGNL